MDVFVDGVLITSTMVDLGGRWRVPLLFDVPGARTITALQRRADCAAQQTSVSVQVSCPCAPPIIQFPLDQSVICLQEQFFGVGTPGAGIDLCIRRGADDVFCDTAAVGPDGAWRVSVPVNLPNGAYVVAVAQSGGGCASAEARSAFTVDCACPPPEIHSPHTGGSVCGLTALSGVGTPGAVVSACVRDGGNEEVFCGAAAVDPDGSWRLAVPVILPNGAYTAAAYQTTAVCVSGENANAFTVDCACPPPEIAEPQPGLITCDLTDVTGTGAPGAAVSLCIRNSGGSNVFCGSAVVDTNGSWQVPLSGALADGAYTITVSQASAQCTSGEAIVSFTLLCRACVEPVIFEPFGDAINCAPFATVLGGGEPNSQIQLEIIGPDGTYSTTATVSSAFSWQAEFPPMPIGDYTVIATQLGRCPGVHQISFTLVDCE